MTTTIVESVPSYPCGFFPFRSHPSVVVLSHNYQEMKEMKTEKEIREMCTFFKEEMKRLDNKGYHGTSVFLRDEAISHILEWVLL